MRMLAAGEQHALALTADGRVHAWGENRYGQLGEGSHGRRPRPTPVLNTRRNGLLDLAPAIENRLPAALLPPFVALSERSGGLTATRFSVQLLGALSGDPGGARRAGGQQVFVAALAGAGSPPAWFQLPADRQWRPLSWPLASFMTDVAAGANAVLLDLLDRVDLSSFDALQLFVGYGPRCR